ncbi:MAG: UDP-N-acetylmuramoyl-tripeptide--D-alanyl-D-alanine ligase, partial [Bacteriovoracaceae bacterium]|nr:UDP-N-acetylmuramoyl-tripeptide--D-alanyl-D-alanine ligase [Bacteriovoracaceae bacterium]
AENDALANASENKTMFVAVEDSVKFFQAIANKIAKNFVEAGGKLIAISGSNGKTTTKEMLFHIVHSLESRTVCTQKNNNNHIGVPLSLLQLRNDEKICILELGSNHPGEIKLLCDIAEPNIGITTNIGDTHLEFFDNQENVFKEEGYLYYAIEKSRDENKIFFKNCDDVHLSTLKDASFVINFGKNPQNSLRIERDHRSVEVSIKDKFFNITNTHITGEHNFLNLGLAFGVARHVLDCKDSEILEAAQSFRPTKNRSEWIRFNNTDVFLDAYNANPSSMRAAIAAFKQDSLAESLELKETLLILGDMNELGDNSVSYHKGLGEFCAEQGFSEVVFIGRHSSDYNEGFNGKGLEFETVNSFLEALPKHINSYKRVFLKGSRSLQLESIVDIN